MEEKVVLDFILSPRLAHTHELLIWGRVYSVTHPWELVLAPANRRKTSIN
jgi:hypothetical protein